MDFYIVCLRCIADMAYDAMLPVYLWYDAAIAFDVVLLGWDANMNLDIIQSVHLWLRHGFWYTVCMVCTGCCASCCCLYHAGVWWWRGQTTAGLSTTRCRGQKNSLTGWVIWSQSDLHSQSLSAFSRLAAGRVWLARWYKCKPGGWKSLNFPLQASSFLSTWAWPSVYCCPTVIVISKVVLPTIFSRRKWKREAWKVCLV